MILPGVAISLGILNNSTNLIDTEIGQSQYPSLNTKGCCDNRNID